MKKCYGTRDCKNCGVTFRIGGKGNAKRKVLYCSKTCSGIASRQIQTTRTCGKCNISLPVSAFNKRGGASTPHSLQRHCIDCGKAVNREWYQRNKVRHTENTKKWMAENVERRRTIIREGFHAWKSRYPESYSKWKATQHNRRVMASLEYVWTKQDIAAVYERCGDKCLACGSTANLSIDHIHPVSKGGSNRPENLQILCLPCNISKGAKLNWTGRKVA